MIHPDWGWMALVGSAVLLHQDGRRRAAAAGLGVLALALGALEVGGTTRLPGDFAAIELALLLVGLAVLAAAVLPAMRRGRSGAAGAALLVGGVALLGRSVGTLAHAAPAGGTLGAVGVVAGMAALGWAATGTMLRRLRGSGSGDARRSAARWLACAWAGVLLAALSPHVLLVLAGGILAAISLAGDGIRGGRFSSALLVAIVLAALLPAGWLFATIAGDQSLATRALSDLPLSPAAEALLAPLLVVAGWAVAGLWPMPRSPLAGVAGLAGLFLIGRLAVPALPEGLDHWRPLAYPILAVGLWQAVLSRRWAATLTGGALFALISGSAGGTAAAWWLGAAALLATTAGYLDLREGRWLGSLAALAAGLGLLPGVAAGLEVEVVYTTLTVAGLALLLAADRGRRSPR